MPSLERTRFGFWLGGEVSCLVRGGLGRIENRGCGFVDVNEGC